MRNVDPLAGIDLAAPPPPPSQGGAQDPLAGIDLSTPRQAELRAMPAGQQIPSRPIADDLSHSAGFWTTARASLAPDVNDQIRRFAAARFPGVPLEEAVKNYGVINGNIVYADPVTGQVAREVPSVSGSDGLADAFFRVGRWVAGQAGPAIPQAASATVGGILGPTGASIPAAGGAAIVGDQLRQALDRALAGEDLTPTAAGVLNSLGQGALAATGQGVGVLATKALTSNPLGVQAYDRMTAVDPAKQAEWQALQDEARRRGIPLSAGEVTDLPSLKINERVLRRDPATTDRMTKFVEERNAQAVPAAVRQELDNIAPAKPLDEVVGSNPDFPPTDPNTGATLARPGLRGAAQDILDQAATSRTMVASPHYEAAFNSGVTPDVSNVIASIQTKMQQYPPDHPAYKALNTALRSMTKSVATPSGGTTLQPQTDYRYLHNAKNVLDDALSKLRAEGSDPSAMKFASREIADVQRDLTTALKTAHPEYAAGWQSYIDMSQPIEELKRSGVAILANKNGPERMAVIDGVLGARNVTPSLVSRTRRAFEANGKMDEWNSGVRAWLEDRLMDATSVNANGRPGNVPGKLYSSIWGDDRQKDILKAAIGDPQRVEGMEKLMDVLKAAGRSLPEGSPTATDILASQNMQQQAGRAARMIGAVGSPRAWAEGTAALADAYNAARTPAARRQLAEALLAPDAADKLKRLRMLNPTSERAAVIATQLLGDAGLLASGATQPADFAPPADPGATQ